MKTALAVIVLALLSVVGVSAQTVTGDQSGTTSGSTSVLQFTYQPGVSYMPGIDCGRATPVSYLNCLVNVSTNDLYAKVHGQPPNVLVTYDLRVLENPCKGSYGSIEFNYPAFLWETNDSNLTGVVVLNNGAPNGLPGLLYVHFEGTAHGHAYIGTGSFQYFYSQRTEIINGVPLFF